MSKHLAPAFPAVEAEAASQPLAPARRTGRRWWRWAWGMPVVLILFAVRLWFWPHEFHGIILQAQAPMADFSLMTSSGETMHLSDFRNKYVLLFFGYTSCPDFCPMTLADLKQARAQLARRQDELQVILVSVDPDRDTPQRLASYLAAFDPTFLGMTGTQAEISSIATRFGVFFDVAPGDGNFVEHTGTITLLDPAGRVRLLFPPGTSGEDIASDLLYLMRRPG